ncbi:zinc-ribbon domain-containing protein [Thermodesulfobacteriota bacterium]
MLVKCKKCQTKLKVSDEKVTKKGIKVKCPKCATILLVKKPAEQPVVPPPMEEQSAVEESVDETSAPTEEAPEPEVEESTISLDEFSTPSTPLNFSEEERLTEELLTEEPAGESLSLDEFELDAPDEAPAEESLEEPAEELLTEEPVGESLSIDEFELDAPDEAPAEESLEEPAEELLAEEPVGESLSIDEFELSDEVAPEEPAGEVLHTEESAGKEQPVVEEPAVEDVLEGFDDAGFSTDTPVGGTAPEAPAIEESAEEFQLDSDFDFSGEPEDAEDELKSDLDLAGDVSPGELHDETAEVEETSSTPDLADTDNISYDFDEPSLSLKDEEPEEDETETTNGYAPPSDDFSSPSVAAQSGPSPQTQAAPQSSAQPQPQARRKPQPAATKEVTGFGVSSRRSMPIIIPLILVVAIIGAAYFAYTKVMHEKGNETGELIILDARGKFVDNEKEGKVFIITGKVKNGYGTARSLIKVAGILYDSENNPIPDAKKEVYAGNVPTNLECRKLPIEAIDELLNKKMGEELSNMNVSSDTSIGFKIVFAGIDEKAVDQFKVIGAGSQLAYNR